MSQAGVMWDSCVVTLDELSQKGELDVVGHDVRRTLDVAFLHENL